MRDIQPVVIKFDLLRDVTVEPYYVFMGVHFDTIEHGVHAPDLIWARDWIEDAVYDRVLVNRHANEGTRIMRMWAARARRDEDES